MQGRGYQLIEMQFCRIPVHANLQGARYTGGTGDSSRATASARGSSAVVRPLRSFESIPTHRNKIQDNAGASAAARRQPATTLSGGEAQRVKLSAELSKRATGKTLYILDEPTTGLAFSDAEMLLTVLHRLVDGGNSVLLIEHHLDMIKNADWIIDLGPGPGERGGELVAEGTPEEIALVKNSSTGDFLREALGIKEAARNGNGRKPSRSRAAWQAKELDKPRD